MREFDILHEKAKQKGALDFLNWTGEGQSPIKSRTDLEQWKELVKKNPKYYSKGEGGRYIGEFDETTVQNNHPPPMPSKKPDVVSPLPPALPSKRLPYDVQLEMLDPSEFELISEDPIELDPSEFELIEDIEYEPGWPKDIDMADGSKMRFNSLKEWRDYAKKRSGRPISQREEKQKEPKVDTPMSRKEDITKDESLKDKEIAEMVDNIPDFLFTESKILHDKRYAKFVTPLTRSIINWVVKNINNENEMNIDKAESILDEISYVLIMRKDLAGALTGNERRGLSAISGKLRKYIQMNK